MNETMDVLLIEDSPGDVRLTCEAFRDANKSVQVHVAPDGMEAMAFLRRKGMYANAPRPKLILLDLNLPQLNGHDVLACVKGDEVLKSIPTVVMTTADWDTDIFKSYQLQANCYVQKPTHFDAFQSLVRSINRFWLTDDSAFVLTTKANVPGAQ
jgi:chemotaxis family two-component system response regulator Rcp1